MAQHGASANSVKYAPAPLGTGASEKKGGYCLTSTSVFMPALVCILTKYMPGRQMSELDPVVKMCRLAQVHPT